MVPLLAHRAVRAAPRLTIHTGAGRRLLRVLVEDLSKLAKKRMCWCLSMLVGFQPCTTMLSV